MMSPVVRWPMAGRTAATRNKTNNAAFTACVLMKAPSSRIRRCVRWGEWMCGEDSRAASGEKLQIVATRSGPRPHPTVRTSKVFLCSESPAFELVEERLVAGVGFLDSWGQRGPLLLPLFNDGFAGFKGLEVPVGIDWDGEQLVQLLTLQAHEALDGIPLPCRLVIH